MDPFIKQYIDRINFLNEEIQELVDAIEIYEEIANHIEPLDDDAMLAEEHGKKFIKGANKNGSLANALKTKKGNKVSEGKLEAAAKKPGKMGARAKLALKLKNLKKKKK